MSTADTNQKRKSETLNLRIDAETRAVIARAAAARHTSVTAFVTDAAFAAAQRELLDQRFLDVGADVFDAVEALLAAPPRPSKRLVALLRDDRAWID